MKRNILYILCLGLVSLTGCKKFLDKEPDNRTHITTPDQLSQLLTNAYPQGSYLLFCESMSDNAEDRNSSGVGVEFLDKINRQSYRYEVVEATPDMQDSPDFYWYACYKAIAQANLALQIIDESSNKAQLTAQRAEALIARAYAHFMLVTLFSKAYDPATAASDPGIPYVTVPEKVIFAKYERKTVAYVYDMIEKDLKEGYPLINEQIYGTAPKFHFNRQAAAAFAARFYLFKRDYNNVIAYAGQAVSGTAADNLRPWNTDLQNLQYYNLQAEYTKATLRGNLLLHETFSNWGVAFPSLRYGAGINTYTQTLGTRNVSGWYYAYPAFGTANAFNVPKFYPYFVTESINAAIGTYYNIVPLFTAEEALLNRTEAYIRINNKAAAIDDLNAFISKNIDDYDPSTDNVTTKKIVDYYKTTTDTAGAMIQATLDFKRGFTLFEGLRWFDILRLKIPVTHTTAAGEVITLGADDKRRALQLPIPTKQAGLEPNVR